MNFTPFLKLLNVIKVLHWTTKSHAAHKELDEAYDNFSDKIDEFVECYLGKKTSSLPMTVGVIRLPENCTEDKPLDIFRLAYEDFHAEIKQYAENSSMQSLLDDLDNIAYTLTYLLRMA